MDRLPLVILLVALTGCDDGASSGAAPPSRVVAVAARAEDPGAELCDVTPDRALVFPALADGAPPAATGPRWINVWATWCQPCVEEMPLITAWGERLREDHLDVGLVFISADRDAEAVTRFADAHPGTPETLRIEDPEALPAWAESVGLDAGATLPIHVLTDARAQVRCARTGAVRERDYDALRGVFAAM